jgi:hypothetical protein
MALIIVSCFVTLYCKNVFSGKVFPVILDGQLSDFLVIYVLGLFSIFP